MCVYVHIYMCAVARVGQKRVSGPLQLESQEVVSCLMYILGTKLSSSARSTVALKH